MTKDYNKNDLLGHYATLKRLYEDPIANKEEIDSINTKIQEILASQRANPSDHDGKYNSKTGIYETPEQVKKVQDEILRIEKTKGAEFDPRKHSIGGSVLGNPPPWYSTHNVAFLTDALVPAGTEELEKSLVENALKFPLTFSYLKTPDPNNNTHNHFVTFNIENVNDKVVVDYVDSNGQLMAPEERAVLRKVYGDKLEIRYRDKDGMAISEQDAQTNPMLIDRSQFDDHSCGPRSAEATKTFKKANTLDPADREVFLQKQLSQLKHQNFDNVRKVHDYAIQNSIVYEDMKLVDESRFTMKKYNHSDKQETTSGEPKKSTDRNFAHNSTYNNAVRTI